MIQRYELEKITANEILDLIKKGEMFYIDVLTTDSRVEEYRRLVEDVSEIRSSFN